MNIRIGTKEDVSAIVALLANDPLGRAREDYREPLPDVYYQAFQIIDQDPHQSLVIVEKEGQVIGTLQLTLIPSLTYQGGMRAQVEAVRIHQEYRGQGIGKKLFRWAISEAERKGAHLLQLTTDKKRPAALRFYEEMGFKATHEGMKLHFRK